MEVRVGEVTFRLVRGSVLDQPVEAIVNPANKMMRGGGGLDGAIHMAAGRNLLLELQRVAPRGAKTSEVVVTGGHETGFKHILHVAGPIWDGGEKDEEAKLVAAYRNVVLAADELPISSLCLPSISTGSFGYPLELAAPVALRTVVDAVRESRNLRLVVFAMFLAGEYVMYEEEFVGLGR